MNRLIERAVAMLKSSRGRIAQSAGWLIADKVVRLGLGFLVVAYMARYLGPERYGVLSWAMALAAMTSVFSTLGMDSILVRELVDHPTDRGRVIGTAIVLKGAGAIVQVLVCLVLSAVLFPGDQSRALVVLLTSSSYLFRAFDVLEYRFHATVDGHLVFAGRAASFVVVSVLRIVAVGLSSPLPIFAVLLAVETLTAAIGLYVAYSIATRDEGRWKFDLRLARRLVIESWPLLLSSMASMFYMRVDQIMIGQLIGDAALGLYSAAVRISEVWYFVPMALVQSVFPTIVKQRKNDGDRYERSVRIIYALLVLLSVLVATAVSFLSPGIIRLLYGDAFIGATNSLVVHIWSGVFVSLGVASSQWFLLEGLQKLTFYRTLVGLIANIALNALLIPRIGIVGAAIGTVCAQAAAAYLFDISNSKTRGQFLVKTRALLVIPLIKLAYEKIDKRSSS